MILEIRTAAPGEAATIHSIVRAAFAEYDGKLPVPPGALHESLADMEQAVDEGRTLIAWDGEQAVGTVRYQVFPDYLYVGRLAVLPPYRRAGVGRAVMRHLEALAAQLDLPKVRLATRRSMPGNLEFYRRAGYHVVQTEPHSKGPDVIVWFEKQIEQKDR